jgi:hypothetical protein
MVWLSPNIAIEHGVQMVRELLSFHPRFVVYEGCLQDSCRSSMGATSNTVEETEGLVEFFTEDDGVLHRLGIPIMKYMKKSQCQNCKTCIFFRSAAP